MNALAQTWKINARMSRMVLDFVPDGLLGQASSAGGKTISGHLAHLHNVRRMWLGAAAPHLAESLEKLNARMHSLQRVDLALALDASAEAMSQLFDSLAEPTDTVKSTGQTGITFLAYTSAHEAHHRGQVLLVMRELGHTLPTEQSYRLWEWK